MKNKIKCEECGVKITPKIASWCFPASKYQTRDEWYCWNCLFGYIRRKIIEENDKIG